MNIHTCEFIVNVTKYLSPECQKYLSYFTLAPYTRLNWQISVSFQAHVKTSYSCRIIVKRFQKF